MTAADTASLRLRLGHVRGGWYAAAHGRPADGDEIGLRAISYASRDDRVFSGWELRLLAEDGHAFEYGDADEMPFD